MFFCWVYNLAATNPRPHPSACPPTHLPPTICPPLIVCLSPGRHNAYVLTASRWYTSPTSFLLVGCGAPLHSNHMLREILSNLVSAVKRWRVRLLGDRCAEEYAGLNKRSLSFPCSFFHEEPVMSVRWMAALCPLPSSQHALHRNLYFNMSNYIFVAHYMSEAGASVWPHSMVCFDPHHLFPLPSTQANCIKKTKPNICCPPVHAVMDMNVLTFEYFTMHPWKLWGTFFNVCRKEEMPGASGDLMPLASQL